MATEITLTGQSITIDTNAVLDLIDDNIIQKYMADQNIGLNFKDDKEIIEHLKQRDYKVFAEDDSLETVILEYADDLFGWEYQPLADLLKTKGYVAYEGNEDEPHVSIKSEAGGLNDDYLVETIDELLKKYSAQQLAEHLKQLS